MGADDAEETAGGDERLLSQAVNPNVLLDALSAVRKGLVDAAQRQMVDVLRAHVTAELIELDIDALMATMVDEPDFRFYGHPFLAPVLSGREAVRQRYLESFAAGPRHSALIPERIMVAPDALFLETTLVSRATLSSVPTPVAAMIDFDHPWVIRKPFAVVVPFRDGLMVGERCWFDGPIRIGDIQPVRVGA